MMTEEIARRDSTHRETQLTWMDGISALIVGGFAMGLFGRTITPGLLPGDGGEFQTLAYLLGSTHPTGYPVFLALARLFTLLPLGEFAYRVNLFSAVMGALTVSGVYLCGRLLSGYRAAAAAGALALAVSATFWSQSLIAEVYTAGAAFFVFILLMLLLWDKSGDKWALFAAGLLGGLSLGVHMSVALLAPAVLLFLLLHWNRGWPMWKSALSGALSGLALTVLIFLLIEWNDPTASYFNAVIEPSRSAWGYEASQIDDPLEHLLFGWQGRQFQHLMFTNSGEVMTQLAADYWANLGQEFTLPLILLAGAGAIWLMLRRTAAAALLLGALLIQLLYFFNYDIWDLYVFYIPSYVLLALFAVAGLGALIELTARVVSKIAGGRTVNNGALDLLLALLILAFAVWPILQPRQEGVMNRKVDFEFAEYPQYDSHLQQIAAATVAGFPQNALVFTDWDMMWPYYYAAYLESDRVDLAFFETYPADDQDAPADSLVEFVITNLDKHPIFFEERIAELEEMEQISMGPRRIGPTRFFSVIEIEE